MLILDTSIKLKFLEIPVFLSCGGAMSSIIDETTGFVIGTPEQRPLDNKLPSTEELNRAFDSLILSASGWRKVFAQSEDEEDAGTEIGLANQVIVAHMAASFAWYLNSKNTTGQVKTIVLGTDSRPTSREIADIMSRVFIGAGFSVKYLFISAAPEIMAYARFFMGFAYVSASHNPIGHNGVKFGLNDGGVIPGSEAALVIDYFKKSCLSPDSIVQAQQLIFACSIDELKKVWSATGVEKQKALRSYKAFTKEVVSAENTEKEQNLFFDTMRSSIAMQKERGGPLSIVADFNGSARASSIDRSFFESLGITLFGLSEKPGAISHRIVPEGSSLLVCAHEIERLRKEGKTPAEKGVSLGYMPDCDGDRGNIVYWNEKLNKALPLEAQEVFALSVIAELAHLVYLEKSKVIKGKKAHPPIGIAINDPTSLRIEAIAQAFGADVARAEVGEANVVNLARELREKGHIVRILGEGSNGGNITHPAAVRDPLNTIFALLKLLIVTDTTEKQGLFHIWCSLSGQEALYKNNFTLADILETLPAFSTTSVYEKEAILHIKTMDHSQLKRNFQSIFVNEWALKKNELKTMIGVSRWEGISNNGTKQTNQLSDFGLSGKGGLKVQFYDDQDKPIAFIWMRGSGTEPVFRILCDVIGSDVSKERYLLAWLTKMVLEADSKI